MKPLVIIPARGGSKGVPRKNIKLLGDYPLINYTLKEARKLFDDKIICVSTDDLDIKSIVEKEGLIVPFLRPAELATDTMGTYNVLIHAIQFYEDAGYYPDIIVLLQPTSPFRTSEHIFELLNLYSEDLDMVVSVKETKSNPYSVLFEEDEFGYLKSSKEGNYTRRQDCPKVYELNGAIYVINVSSLKKGPINEFKKIVKYEMDEFSSHDIDTLFDWKIAEVLLENKLNES